MRLAIGHISTMSLHGYSFARLWFGAGMFKRWWPALILLFILWLTRITVLDVFPFHVDEGIHVRWAIEVWHGHPFWNISDAKIIAHWPIAAFYPQNTAPFVARMPTVMIAMLGLAAGYALVLRLFGRNAAFLAGALWICSPYLFFYERMALMDGEIGDLGVVALWASVLLARRGTYRNAILAGVTLAAAILFKLTAVVFVPMVGLIPLLNGHYPLRRRLSLIVTAGIACAACFIVPLAYIVLTGEDFFDIPRQFVSVEAAGQGIQFFANIEKLWLQLVGFGTPIWVIALLIGLVGLVIFGGRWGRLLTLAWAIALAIILVLGKTVFPRYYVAVLPTALLLAGAGLGVMVNQLKLADAARRGIVVAVTLLLAAGVLPFMSNAYNDPSNLTLSAAMQEQYYTGPSSGFGISVAASAFPDLVERADLPVIASMRPDSCYQANFYAREGILLTCTDAPGIEAINAALAEHGAVYVLTDHAPIIGVDVTTLDAKATRIADFPRPSEVQGSPSVVLWLLES
jgi:4-amino-4-deoxy-L-arabinose transferase-like glycosyltransferase